MLALIILIIFIIIGIVDSIYNNNFGPFVAFSVLGILGAVVGTSLFSGLIIAFAPSEPVAETTYELVEIADDTYYIQGLSDSTESYQIILKYNKNYKEFIKSINYKNIYIVEGEPQLTIYTNDAASPILRWLSWNFYDFTYKLQCPSP